MRTNTDGMELVRYEWDPRTGLAIFVYERNGTELQPVERVQVRHWTSPESIEHENRLERERFERRRARRDREQQRRRGVTTAPAPSAPPTENPEIW